MSKQGPCQEWIWVCCAARSHLCLELELPGRLAHRPFLMVSTCALSEGSWQRFGATAEHPFQSVGGGKRCLRGAAS